MATHSSVLAWRIPGTGSLVGYSLWGRTESDTTEATSDAAAASSIPSNSLLTNVFPDFFSINISRQVK